MAPLTTARIRECIDTIEKSYEFLLSYAALGAENEAASKVGSQLRDYLQQTRSALDALAEGVGRVDAGGGNEKFLAIVAADAGRAKAVVGAVLRRPTISSHIVDNLNASAHVRTVLTDLFLLDELL